MSTISISLTEGQFQEYVYPYLNTAKGGYESKIPWFKLFNYIFYKLHTGCQWEQVPIELEPRLRKKGVKS